MSERDDDFDDDGDLFKDSDEGDEGLFNNNEALELDDLFFDDDESEEPISLSRGTCPNCHEELSEKTKNGRKIVYCESCGYVDGD